MWADMDTLVDSDEYSQSQQQALEEQVVKNPSDYTMSLEEYQHKRQAEEAAEQKQQEEERHVQAMAQAKEKDADDRRMAMIETFYAQKEAKIQKEHPVDEAHKYIKNGGAVEKLAQAAVTNEHNQQMLFQ